MKTWIKRTLIGLVGASVLLGGVAAWSHREHGEHGDHRRWQAMSEGETAAFKARVLEKAAGKLDLDAKQKSRLGVLVDRLREQRNALIGSTTDPRAELKALVAGTTFDRARAEALVMTKTEALRGKAPEVIAATADFYDSLRPEQQAQLKGYLDRGRRWGRS